MKDTQIILNELLNPSLFGCKPNISASADWLEIYNEAEAQAVISLITPSVACFSGITDKEINKWKDADLINQAHYVRILYEQTELV